MAEPFDDRTDKDDGIGSRLRGRKSRASAAREIEALLATAPSVLEVTPAQVSEIVDRHGVRLDRQLRTPARNFYRRFFEFCLVDHAVTDEEAAELEHLRAMLSIDDADAESVHDEVARVVYGAAVEVVLEDHRLDPEEAAFLHRLQDHLNIDEQVASETIESQTARSRQRYLAKVASTDDLLLTSQEIKLTLDGSSTESLGLAVANAIHEACAALPELKTVDVDRIRVDIDDGNVKRWHVSLRAVLDRE